MSILPIALRGTTSTNSSRSGALLRGEAGCGAVVADFGERQRTPGIRCRAGEADDRAHPLAGPHIGDADHGDVLDERVRVQEILDLGGRDVLCVADDDVLDAPGHGDEAVGGDDAEVSGAEEALLVEHAGIERGIGVAGEHLRPTHAELPFPTRGLLDAVERDHADLDAGRGPALRGRDPIDRVGEPATRRDRELREPPAVDDPEAAELVAHLLVDAGRERRAAVHARAQAGEQALGAVRALGVQVGLEERQCAPEDRRAPRRHGEG